MMNTPEKVTRPELARGESIEVEFAAKISIPAPQFDTLARVGSGWLMTALGVGAALLASCH